MIDKFTSQFQSVLGAAQSLAAGSSHAYIEPIHILSSIVPEQQSLLQLAQVNIAQLNQCITDKLRAHPQVSNMQGNVQLSRSASGILQAMEQQATKNQDAYIASELFFIALLDSSDSAKECFTKAGADKKKLEQAIQQVRGGERVQDQNAE